MTLSERINADIKTAMLAKDKDRLAALRDIKAKLLIEASAGSQSEVSDQTASKIILKLYKQRIDTYNLYIEQGREDLAQEEMLQAKVIQEYMPQQLSNEEIRSEVKKAIITTQATAPSDMGNVMKILTASLSGKADGKIISQLVKEELSSLK